MRAAVAILVAVLTLASCERPGKSKTVFLDPALVPLIPAGTTMLAGFEVEELKRTSTWKKLVAGQKLPQVDELARQTGIDVRQDVWDVLLASDGKNTVILARGKFGGGLAKPEVEPQIKGEGVRKFPYKGYTLQGNEKFAVVFFNMSVAVAGPTEAVKGVIDARDGSKGKASEALLNRVRAIPSTNHIWGVSTEGFKAALPSDFGERMGRGPMGNLAGLPIDVREIVFSVDLSDGIHAEVDALSGDAANAKKLHDAFRGLLGIGRLTTPDDKPEMLKFYDGVNVKLDQSRLTVTSDVPLELFEKFLPGLSPSSAPESRRPGS